MSLPQEFHYRLPGRAGGYRPGAHSGSSIGAGQEFATHMSLYDRPDPRRLDVRSSLRTLRDEWLVRVSRQRVGVAVHALIDVSASMSFGPDKPKLHVAADFLEALGHSAFRLGDALGVLAFDAKERPELYAPARVSRGTGPSVAHHLRRWTCSPGGLEGLQDAAAHLAGRSGMVFLISDFHWPLERLGDVLDLLAHAHVVPMIVWDPAEIEPPERDALAPLRDMETGSHRTLWLRPKLRERWRTAVATRRAELNAFFNERGMPPFYVLGQFDGDAMSRYFFDATP